MKLDIALHNSTRRRGKTDRPELLELSPEVTSGWEFNGTTSAVCNRHVTM